MAKLATPPSKPPADKGNHIVLNFPVANVKEQSVKVEFNDAESKQSGTGASIVVSFETFSPTKRYEKVLTVPESVSLRQQSKNVSSKNLSIILVKAAHAAPPSPTSKPSSEPAPASPVLAPIVAEAPILQQAAKAAPVADAAGACRSCNGTGTDFMENRCSCEAGQALAKTAVTKEAAASNGASRSAKTQALEQSDDDLLDDIAEANGDGTHSGKKKKKNKPRKKAAKAKGVVEEEEEKAEDPQVIAVREGADKIALDLQAAEELCKAPKKELADAEATEQQAAQKVQHFEAELRTWQAHYEAEIRKWQGNQKKARAHAEDCKARLSQAQSTVATLEARASAQKALVRDAEAMAMEREREEQAKEDERRQEEEREAQEEKQKEQEERRKRAEEERQRANEEKKKKEAGRKENAKRREEESKKAEEEEERRKMERKGKTAPTGAAAGLAAATAKGDRPVYLDAPAKQKIAALVKLFKKDPAAAQPMMEEASKGSHGPAFLTCLAQCLEDSKDFGASGLAYLQTLAHPDAETVFSEKDRTNISMKAIGLLKDHPDKLCQCKALLEKLSPKYSILAMGLMMADKAPKSAATSSTRPQAAAQASRSPLIEEVASFPNTSTEKPMRATGAEARCSATAASAEDPESAGWILELDTADGAGACWTLELPVPSIETLAEVNLDISGEAILLTSKSGGAPVARSMVPDDANADEASAKWSKKKRVLTIRMPQV